MSSFTILLFFLLPLITRAVPLTSRTVYDPPITDPNAQTVWMVGDSKTVTWDTSSLPANLTNEGMVVLGFEANNSENLMLDTPLATKFLLTDGMVGITVPNVPPRNDYIVVLFGDSGNASPQFTITGGTSSTSSQGTTSTSTENNSAGTSDSSSTSTEDNPAGTSDSSSSTTLPPDQYTATVPSPSPTPSVTPTPTITSPAAPKTTTTPSQLSPQQINAAWKAQRPGYLNVCFFGIVLLAAF